MTDPLGLIGSTSGLGPVQPAAPKLPQSGPEPGPSFKEVLINHIEQVNRLQQDAATAVEDLTSGKRDDLATVLMAQRKADEAFHMLLQVRNKLTDAYEELKQIRV